MRRHKDANVWPALLQAGLRLGISPSEFWRLSLREWQALSGARASVFRRSDLSELIALFPDGDG